MPICEGPSHHNRELVDGKLLEATLKPTESTITRYYLNETHYFCTNSCYHKWYFYRLRSDGLDVSNIQLTTNGNPIYCQHCHDSIVYGSMGKFTSAYLGFLKVYFCTEDHLNQWEKLQKDSPETAHLVTRWCPEVAV